MVSRSILALCLAAAVYGHGDHDDHQKSMSGPHQSLWYNTIPGDGGTQVFRNAIDPALERCLTHYRPTLYSRAFPPLVACHTSHASAQRTSSTTLPSLVSKGGEQSTVNGAYTTQEPPSTLVLHTAPVPVLVPQEFARARAV